MADGTFAIFAHMMDKSHLQVGDWVNAGDLIGLVGNTGVGTGHHLHYTREDKDKKPFEPSDEEVQYFVDNFNAECVNKTKS